ncbi:class I SAM-dependent methyltransferase [Argonema galeatum]|uniref:class I SAM-dependent methyltransferase n=1 Tax=Argonema galeatum TaxID=2942762 RepID=UPI002011F31C|nr:class I SAM-dependent methyltransferase [Argonema galeatum]MCL1463994.1 class I SAM-dependent methyltransferase [Argonema galeatum A003/A1]
MKAETNIFNPAYIGERNDVLTLVPAKLIKVIDVGCSIGKLGKRIEESKGAEIVIGIEFDKEMAEVAKNNLDEVIVGDIEQIDWHSKASLKDLDCLIFADVLEHLKDPWRVLKQTTELLAPEVIVIASIPNIRHYDTLLNLVVKGYWPYRKSGIHDRTHLRFFTLKNIEDMFQEAELEIVKIERNYRTGRGGELRRFYKYLAVPLFRDFVTFQYLIVAKKIKK